MTRLYHLGKEYAGYLPDGLPVDHPGRVRNDDLKKYLGDWTVHPGFIVNSLKNGDSYQIGNVPPDIPDKTPRQTDPMQALIDRMGEQAEIIPNLYLHLHNEGHSVGIDSSVYRQFRDAVKAVHKLWNPPENRRLDLNTHEGRMQAQDLFRQVSETANVYYLKHLGRDIKSTYGNIRRNAALTAIDTVDPQMAKDYISQYVGAPMKMARGGSISREQIGVEDLIRSEKAYSTLQYGNRNSKPYGKEAEMVRKHFQDDEDREARTQNRAPHNVNKEDAVNRYLNRRNHH